MKFAKLLCLLLTALVLGLPATADEENLCRVKISYADGQVLEKHELTEQQTLELMLEMLRSDKDGTYELWDDKGVHAKFVLEGDTVKAHADDKESTMTRAEMLRRIAPPEPDDGSGPADK